MRKVYTIPIMDNISIESVEKQMKEYIEKYKLWMIRHEMGGNKGIHNLSMDTNILTNPNSLRSM